jgi:serine phosphatase RsbU (regulator of sigma subunit)
MLRGRSRAEVLLQGLPFLIMAAVAASYVIAGPGVGIIPLLSLGPAFATLTGGIRHTLVLSGIALVLCAALAAVEGQLRTQRVIVAFVTILGVTAAALIATSGRRRRERELTEVQAIADVAQRVLLRPVPRQVGRIRLAVRYISASSGARIGGDLYEVAIVADTLRLVVGDVQGKGLRAAQAAATALGAFREAAFDAADLPAIASRIEASLLRLLTEEQFVTAILAEVSCDGSAVQLLNCGHPPPLLLSGSAGRYVETPDAGLPLGMTGLRESSREPVTIALAPGDAVLFYTDGVSEARNKAGRFYPLASRVLRGTRDPDTVLDYLRNDVLRHTGHPLDDDAAMLMISYVP